MIPTSPTIRETRDPPRCYFLELPTELRLQIYDYALAESESVTIASATVLDEQGESFNSQTSFNSIPELPDDHVPLIKSLHDPGLLSITTPPTIRSPASSFASSTTSVTSLESGSSQSSQISDFPILDDYGIVSAALSLRRACRYINDELSSHLSHQLTTKSTLHISYPYGLLVLKDRCPQLLRQAKEIHIYGAYAVDGDSVRRSQTTDARATRSSQQRREPPSLPAVPRSVVEASTSALGSLVRTILSPEGHSTLEKLELRIYYPYEDSYSQVWSDDNSPVVVALQNTCGGKIEMVCWRGRNGTGLHLTTKPNPNQRVVSTVWKRMDDWGGEGRGEDCERWVIGDIAGIEDGSR